MPVERATGPRGFRRPAKGAAAAAVRERQPSLRTRLVYTVVFLANAVVLAALLWALVGREPVKEGYTEKELDISSGSGRSGSDKGPTRRATHPPTEHFVGDQPSEPVGEDFVTKQPIRRARTTHTRESTPSFDKGEVENPMTTTTTTTIRTSTLQRTVDTSSEWTVPSTNKTTEYASTTSVSEATSSTVPTTTSNDVTTTLGTETTEQTSSYAVTTTEETLSFDVDTSPSYNVVCYFNHTSYKRDEPMSFRTGHIPVPYCSHIIYASVGVGEDFQLVAKDHVFDVERGGFIKFARLKSRYRHVKVMAAIGEDASDSNAFRHMSKNRADVVTFARNVASWLREYEYDGVVLQWKMPVQRQDDASDRASLFRKKLLVVVSVLRESLDSKAELFVALPSNEEIRQAYFNVAELARHVDRFLAISNWALSDGDTDRGAKLTSFPDPLNDVLQTRHSLVGAGNVPLFRKFCFVLSVSARTYTLLNPGRHEIHAAASGPGKPGPFTRQPGVLAYYEFCNETWPTAEKGTFASYVARDDQWVGYLDVSNVQRLLRMALYKHRAACLGIWDVSLDDFRGLCGDAFPYVKAISGWHDKEWKRRRREFGSGRNK